MSGTVFRGVRIGVTLVATLATSHLVSAEFYSGNQLLDFLEADRAVVEKRGADYFKSGIALGYVTGVWDVYSGVAFCGPKEATVNQAMAVALKFLRENPGHLHLAAESLLREAFARAFPCKGK